MAATYDHEYPPAEWTAAGIAEALASAPEAFPLPAYEDAETWAALRDDTLTGPAVTEILDGAREAAGEPVPALPASLYLDYHRTGERYTYQPPNRTRRRRLGRFALAECFEREGTYLDDVLDYAWAICEQASWVIHAHLGDEQNVEGLPGVVPDEERTVALRSAETAQLLAEVDYLLGERLHPALRERVRREVDRRVFTPYEAREDIGWMHPPTNNWNAVCNGSIGVAALHLLDDADRQARILARAAHSLEHYLADFDPDGCTAEGIGYWNYGFGHYVMLAAHLETRTAGEYSLLSPPIVEDIAQYPLKVEMSPGRFIPFSDADEESSVRPYAAAWLGTRLDLPALAARGRRAFRESRSAKDARGVLRNLLWAREVSPDMTVPEPPARQFFGGYSWWLARADPADPNGLVAVAKGGHNGESHNHNDLGSFVVHYRGESLLTDLGAPTYDRDFFGEKRYEYLVARSLGHSVPYANGHEQRAGEEYAAEVLDRTEGGARDTFAVDLTGGYPEATDLERLRRRFALDRDAGTMTVADRARFGSDGNEFASVLVSYFPMEAAGGGEELVVTGERGRATVTPDCEAEIEVERIEGAVEERDVWRARLAPAEVGREAALDLRIEPRLRN